MLDENDICARSYVGNVVCICLHGREQRKNGHWNIAY